MLADKLSIGYQASKKLLKSQPDKNTQLFSGLKGVYSMKRYYG
jgi:hypothetical protein